MACTPEQIEEKRRLAQQKLASRISGFKSPLKSPSGSSFPSRIDIFQNGSSPGRFSPLDINQSSARSLQGTLPSTSNHNSVKNPQHSMKIFVNGPNQNKHGPKPYDKPNPPGQFYGKENVAHLTFSLVSDERFMVKMSCFSTPAIETFKTIPSRNYDPNTRIWSFHISDHESLVAKLSFLRPGVIFDKLPKFVVNLLKVPKRDLMNIDLSKIDPDLLSSLMPFQQEGVCFGIDKKGRCLIADDMGLGKTFQALGIASYYREDWPLLIVTTASMKNVWEETILNHMPTVSAMHTQYMISAKDYINDSLVLIVSHSLITKCVDKLLERKFGVLIIDESHTMKNIKAKCTEAAVQLAKHAKRVILLSGTPALSRPSELYTQLALLDDKFFGNFFDYSKRYCDGKTTNFGWDATGKSNLAELEIVLARRFMIRRTKDEVLKALPNKTQEVVTLDVKLEQFSEEERQCLNSLSDKYNNSKLKGMEKRALLLTFFAETAKIKIPSVCSYILQILDNTNKFLVFAHHQVMLNAIENIMKKKNKKYIRIDGSTTSDQRKYFVDKFQVNDEYICAILSITATNAGLTLTAAQLVLFAELHWNPSILSQAESRAHRIGQNNQVVVRYLIAPGTTDDSLWPMLQEKQKILAEVGLLKDSFTNVTVKKQDKTSDENVTDGLNFTRTHANTMDITSYFKACDKSDSSIQDTSLSDDSVNNSKHVKEVGDELDVFNDGFDDILCSIDL